MFIINVYRLPVKTEAVSALAAYRFLFCFAFKSRILFHSFIKARSMPKKQNFFIYLIFIPSLSGKQPFFLNKMPLFVFLFSFVLPCQKLFLPF